VHPDRRPLSGPGDGDRLGRDVLATRCGSGISRAHRPISHAGRVSDPEEPPQHQTQEQRALQALQAVFGGADLTVETQQLANEFTDRQTGRLANWFKRRPSRS
jgi:hypothetical protein